MLASVQLLITAADVSMAMVLWRVTMRMASLHVQPSVLEHEGQGMRLWVPDVLCVPAPAHLLLTMRVQHMTAPRRAAATGMYLELVQEQHDQEASQQHSPHRTLRDLACSACSQQHA